MSLPGERTKPSSGVKGSKGGARFTAAQALAKDACIAGGI
jgi:hypothetical protein